jgi:hypothetical protein
LIIGSSSSLLCPLRHLLLDHPMHQLAPPRKQGLMLACSIVLIHARLSAFSFLCLY